jgi:hypothetical protein
MRRSTGPLVWRQHTARVDLTLEAIEQRATSRLCPALGSVVLAHDSCAAGRAISERSAVMDLRLHVSSPSQLLLQALGLQPAFAVLR